MNDPRAKSLVRLLRVRAAATASANDDAVKSDVETLNKVEFRALADASGDTRVVLLAAVTKLLEKKALEPEGPPEQPQRSKTDTNTNTNNTTKPVVADAGVAAVSADTAAARPPETFERGREGQARARKRESFKEAAKWAKKALDLREGKSGAQIIEAQLVLGFSYLEMGVHASARQVFTQVLAKDSKSCDAQIGLATAVESERRDRGSGGRVPEYLEICRTRKRCLGEGRESVAARVVMIANDGMK